MFQSRQLMECCLMLTASINVSSIPIAFVESVVWLKCLSVSSSKFYQCLQVLWREKLSGFSSVRFVRAKLFFGTVCQLVLKDNLCTVTANGIYKNRPLVPSIFNVRNWVLCIGYRTFGVIKSTLAYERRRNRALNSFKTNLFQSLGKIILVITDYFRRLRELSYDVISVCNYIYIIVDSKTR